MKKILPLLLTVIILFFLLTLTTVFCGLAIFRNLKDKQSVKIILSETHENSSDFEHKDNSESLLNVPLDYSFSETVDPESFLIVSADKNNVKEEDPITLTYKLYSLLDISEFVYVRLPDFTYFYSTPINNSGSLIPKLENYKGKNYKTAILYQYQLIPLQSGKLNVGNLKICLKFKKPNKGNRTNSTIFDDFFNTYETVEKVIYSPKFEVNVTSGLTSQAEPPTPTKEENGNNCDIIFVVDVSTSLLARDFTPNRLTASKAFITKFANGHPENRIGLIQFAGEAQELSTLNAGHKSLKRSINEIDTGKIKDGTAIGDALTLAISKLKNESSPKMILLVTDGQNNCGSVSPFTAAEIAETYGIKIFTVGISSGDSLVPYPIQIQMKEKIHYVPHTIDDFALQHISLITGGNYFRVKNNDELMTVSINLNERLFEEKQKQKRFYPENKMSNEMIQKVLDFSFQTPELNSGNDNLQKANSDAEPEPDKEPGESVGLEISSLFVAKAPEAVKMGEQFQLSFTLSPENSKDDIKDHELNKLDGFDIIMGPYISTSSSTTIKNGVNTTTLTQTYTYKLSPVKVGKFTIPSASIIVNGRKLYSNSLKINVLKSDSGK